MPYNASINNFVDVDPIKVELGMADESIVRLFQHEVGNEWQHDMTPEQARELARHLMAAADASEQSQA